MRPSKTVIGLGLAIIVALSGTLALPVQAEEGISVADKLHEALELYNQLDNEGALEVAKGLLGRSDLSRPDSIAIYEVLSVITYNMGTGYLQKAFEYLEMISKIGPCEVPLPGEIWPSELRQKWYEVLKTTGNMSCGGFMGDGAKTVAVMEFDNFSIGKYQEELGPLGKGLADFFQHDFAKISDLRVVERDKVNFILKELELQQSGAVDQSTAVKVGKILGAQFMIFGSITQLDSKNTRMVVRMVSVETSEIVASVDKEGRPDYSKMEKELVEELAGKMGCEIDAQTKDLIQEGGTGSVDAASLYAKGLEYMDRYDYSQAYAFFKKAYDADNTFNEAKRMMDIYAPAAG